MSYIDIERSKKLNPFYSIMDLEPSQLEIELKNWSRETLINWLVWNDPNGVYRDVDSKREFNNVLQKEEAIEVIRNQIFNQ